MKLRHVRLALALLPALAAGTVGCTGQFGAAESGAGGSTGSGNSTGSGTGTAGSGSPTGGAGTGAGTAGTGAGTAGSGAAGSGLTGTAGTSGTAGTGGTPKPISLNGQPKYYRLVRLTNDQWARSVQEVLKLATPTTLHRNFETAVAGTTDFANNELVLGMTQRAWTDYQTAAETLAEQVTADAAALTRVYSGTDAMGFITTVGRRAYRRPLTAAEISSLQTIYNTGTTMSGTKTAFAKGAALVIRALLQSPHFLHRTELGTNNQPLNGYEMAAKLSLFLRGTSPNDALLDQAAGPGRLDTVDGAVALAQTMLGEPTATATMRKFHGELLHFDRYLTISKLNVPTYRESLNAEYQETSYLFFDKIFTGGLGVRQILTSTTGFVGPGMAALYGVAAPASGFVERDLGPSRVGYFTQLPYLTFHGINGEPDSIHRGVTINLDVLCVEPGAPGNVPPVPALLPNQTNRERISTLTAGCGGECHNSYINPVGFSFEHFDGMGIYRDTENGKTIDSTGTYPFTEGTKSFANAAELMQHMANGEQAHLCYAKKMSSFALQRDIVAADMPLLQSLKTASMATNGSVKQVILELVRNPAFRTRVGGAQ